MKKHILLFLALGTYSALVAQDKKLSISGFTEIRFETRMGDPAETAQLDSVVANNEDVEDFEDNSRLFLPAFNLLFSSELSDKLTVQSELYFEFEDELRIEFLRLYADYRINPRFNLQVGKFLSPIGYLNRNQRFYGYLNNSVRPRDMVTEENGFIPLFTLGLSIYGSFDLSGISAIKYNLAYGTSRQAESTEGDDIFGVEFGEDVSPGISGLLEWASYGETEVSVGISGYMNPKIITAYVPNGAHQIDGVDPRIEMELSETGFAPYLRLNTNKFQFLGEYHFIKFEDKESVSGASSYNYSAVSLELMYKTKAAGKPFGPYLRYDFRRLDNNHPYFGLEEEGDAMHKNFVTNQSLVMVGVAWDPFPSNRIKIEYGSNFAGAAPKTVIAVSTSFAF